MPAHQKRKLFSLSNKYQKQILLLSIAPQVMITIGMTGFVIFVSYQVTNLPYETWAENMAIWFSRAFYVLIGIIMISLIYTYKISQSLVGPFERIIREMDEVLTTNKIKEIKARPSDELAKDLLKRINQLIKRIS